MSENKPIQVNKPWIFLCHSSKDIEKVREIRNEFEALGTNPLAFHLKCLKGENEEEKTELLSLIHREIDARDWFVYCQSPNAESSKYVSDERRYIESQGKEKIRTIDITLNKKSIQNQIRDLVGSVEVFISYSWKDRFVAKALLDSLAEKDISIWHFGALTPQGDWSKNAGTMIETAGIVVGLMTKNGLSSRHVRLELDHAYAMGTKIVPVIVGDKSLFEKLPIQLKSAQAFFVEEAIKEEFDNVASAIDSMLKERWNG